MKARPEHVIMAFAIAAGILYIIVALAYRWLSSLPAAWGWV